MGWHAKLSASGAYRWLACPGSVRLSEGLPDKTSSYAAEGTAAHDVAARCLTFNKKASEYLGQQVEADGFKFVVDQEMVEAVQIYLDHISSIASHVRRWVEVDLTPALKKLHPDFGGTVDCAVLDVEANTLHVVDLKYGAGVLVSVEDNAQLKYYALGAMLKLEELDVVPEKIVVTIVQPRCGSQPVRTDTFDSFDLIDFAEEIVQGAKAVYAEGAALVPGSHCQFCRAKVTCPKLEEQTRQLMANKFQDLEAVDSRNTNENGIIDLLTDEKLSEVLDMLGAVESRIKAIREEAYERAMKGNPPPGWKLVGKRATRKWNDEAEVCTQLLGTDECFTEPKLKSPAQVEKVLGKKKFKEIEEFVSAVSSGYTLVKESDKRPPAQLEQPKGFNNLGD